MAESDSGRRSAGKSREDKQTLRLTVGASCTSCPETKRIMGTAFEMICAALKYTNRPDIAHEALANRTIELARNGVLDPDRLCERVLNDLRKLPPLRTNMLAFVFVVVSRPAHSTTLV